MKITASQLKRIIKEELQQVFVESPESDRNLPYIEKYAPWVLEDHFGGELEYVEVYEPEDIIPKIGDWINSHLNSLFYRNSNPSEEEVKEAISDAMSEANSEAEEAADYYDD